MAALEASIPDAAARKRGCFAGVDVSVFHVDLVGGWVGGCVDWLDISVP